MPSYSNYQNNYRKNSKSINQFSAPKNMSQKNRSNDWEEKIIDWVTFYRRNIHRFIEHYFQVYLFPYQRVWTYEMNTTDGFVTIASRGVAKSWVLGLFSTAVGTLYPNSEIVVVASTKEQAGIIVGKIARLREDYPNLAREIKDLTSNNNKYEVVLHNGTTIKVVPAKDSARGNRSTFTIYEEFRLIDKQILDSVIRPFAYSRQTPYLKNKEYAHLKEEPKEVFISSAYHKSLWWYQTTANYIKMMMRGKNVGFIAFDYLLTIKHGIKTPKQIAKEREDMDEITFLEEYENIPWGENADAYYKLDMFRKNQDIKRAFYPQRNETFDPKKNPYDIKKVDGEVRLVTVDVATRKGEQNDNTVILCTRLLPTQRGYQRENVYIETHNGENTILQGLRVKQIWYDFKADYIVLDLAQNGISIYDQLGIITKDEERGLEYEALTVMNHFSIDKKVKEELLERTLSINAKPIIYPLSGTPQLNNDIAVSYRDKLQKGMIKFLISEMDAEEYWIKTKKDYLESGERYWRRVPYIQNAAMINETIGLSMKLVGGLIKLEEVSGARKDRYVAGAYMNYFASYLDKDIMKETSDTGSWDYWKAFAETVY
jgi:hypothetical protein